MDFHKSAMLMAGKELSCVDKFGHPLVGGMQVVRNCTVPGRSRATIHCRVNDRQLSGIGFVEGTHTRIQLASSLNRLTDRGEILVQCINPFMEPVTLSPGSLLGHFQTVQKGDIGPSLGEVTEGPQERQSVRNTSRNYTSQPVKAARATKSARLWHSCYTSMETCSAAEIMT